MLIVSPAKLLLFSYGKPEVLYSLAWRSFIAIAGLVSIYLIGHRLSPSEQGYWYSFDSLAVARTVFELGFSMVLMQVASHEYPSLRWSHGLLIGNPEAKSRPSALLRRAVGWYRWVSLITLSVCLVAGERLFGTAHDGPIGDGPGTWLLSRHADS